MMKTTALVLCLILGMTTYAVAEIQLNVNPFWYNTGGEGVLYSTGLQFHDADRDGDLDMFISNGNDINPWRNYMYRNEDGVFPTSWPSWQGQNYEYSGHCAVGDINYDGYPEFVVSNYLGGPGFGYTNNLDAYLNNGGTLLHQPWWRSADSMFSFSCAMGDLDGDGDLDLAVACGEAYGSDLEPQRVYFNVNGVLESLPSWTSQEAIAMLDVALGDVDNDGDLDIAYCGDNSYVRIYFNNDGVIETVPSWQSLDLQCSNTLAFGDVNGDGWLDLAVADNNQLGGTGKFKLYRNNDGTLGPTPAWQSLSGGYGASVSWCDLDYDGDLDLATGRWWSNIMIYENTGVTLTTTPQWNSNSGEAIVVEEIQFADIDGDGVCEYKESIAITPGKKLYYLPKMPIHSVDSVIVDGVNLGFDQHCYSLVDGWVSVGVEPTASMIVYYKWSYKPDLGVSNWDGINYLFENNLVPDFVAGDADGSEFVDIDDIVHIIAYVFLSGPAPDPLQSGDADCSGGVDVDDVVFLINMVFMSGPFPCYP
jgi:hypothetical protein